MLKKWKCPLQERQMLSQQYSLLPSSGWMTKTASHSLSRQVSCSNRSQWQLQCWSLLCEASLWRFSQQKSDLSLLNTSVHGPAWTWWILRSLFQERNKHFSALPVKPEISGWFNMMGDKTYPRLDGGMSAKERYFVQNDKRRQQQSRM